MASNDTNIGVGAASGMFSHAAAGTALPESPFTSPASAWTSGGDVTDDGISVSFDKSTKDLKNWAKVTKRTILTDHGETVKATIMDTTEESMKAIFGEDNVVITPATADHGKLIDVHFSASALPAPEAYLFRMKDGDDGFLVGCTKGQITDLGDVDFAPDGSIKWQVTIKGLEDGWHMIKDDGAKVEG